jgi:Sulfotransferase domain
MAPPKINLIYIASIGRSGSTLLESMLGAHSRIATCGEMHIFPHELKEGGVKPCCCGQSVLECPFWLKVRQVVDPLQQPQPQIHYFRERHNAGKTLRLKRLGEFAQKAPAQSVLDAIQVYGQNNYDVFQAFLSVMQTELGTDLDWIVDASKDPYRLLWLVQSNLFNIKVLHIVKDPRAFVYSVTQSLLKDEKAPPQKILYDTFRQSFKWSIENHLIAQVTQNHLAPTDYLLVNYEQFASEPRETFRKVCEMIGCQFEETAVDNFREGNLHTIAGNSMRYEKRGIALDEKWKKFLPDLNRNLVEMLTQIDRSRYGYR